MATKKSKPACEVVTQFKVGRRMFTSREDAEEHSAVLHLKYQLGRQGMVLHISDVEAFTRLFPEATKELRNELASLEEEVDGNNT